MRPQIRRRLFFSLLALTAGLTPAVEYGHFEGHLVDSAGSAVTGVEVQFTPTDYHGRRAFTAVDDEGRFAVDLEPGRYRVRLRGTELVVRGLTAMAEGDGVVAWEIGGVYAPDEVPAIPIEAGQNITWSAILGGAGDDVPDPASLFRDPLDAATELVQLGKCGEALPQLVVYVDGNPDAAKGHYLLGYCRAVTGDAGSGAESLERALELNPGFPGGGLLLAQVLMQAGRVDDAAAWFARAAESAPTAELRANAWIALGFLERDRGKNEAARSAFEHAMEADAERIEPYAELARLHATSGDAERVAELVEAGREIGEMDIQPLLNVGISRMNDKQYTAALPILDRALELAEEDDERAMVYALLGRCRLGLEKRDEGIAALKMSLQLDGDGRFADECRKILGELDG